MAKSTDANIWLGSKFNTRQAIIALPAGPDGQDPGILFLESTNATGTAKSGVYLWADQTNNLRFSSSKPTDEDASGSLLGTLVGGGASSVLDNLGVTAINADLIPGITDTVNLGTTTTYFKYGFFNRLYLNSTSYIDGASSGVATFTVGDVKITAGKLTIDSITDSKNYIKRNQTTTTGPLLLLQTTHTGDDYPALHVDHNSTQAVNAMDITTDATGFGLSITSTATTATQLTTIGPADQTVSQVIIDGTTGNWIGANTVGMLHLVGDGTLAHAGASLLYIAHSGTTAASATGSSLYINDSATAGNAAALAAYIYSASQHALRVTTNTTSKNALQLKCVAATTAAIEFIDATGWVGASTYGALHITGDGVLLAGANLLHVASTAANGAASYVVEIDASGTFVGSTNGTCLRIIDSGAAAGTSYALYAASTANSTAKFVSTAVGTTALSLAVGAGTTAAVANIAAGAWVGANDVGAVTIAGTGVLLAGSNLLRVTSTGANAATSYVCEIASSGNVVTSTNGICLRVDETGAAAGTSYAAYISSTSNTALGVYAGAVATPTAEMWGIQAQTAAILNINGSTGTGWIGATGVGALTITGKVALAHINASLLYINKSAGAMTAGALGDSLRIVDASTAGAGASYVAYMTSTANHVLGLTGVAVAKTELTLTGPASKTASMLNVVSASINAADIGTIHLANSGNFAHADATDLYVKHTGTAQNATKGICARFIDTSAAATTSAAVQIASTNNRALSCTTGQADFLVGMSTMCSTAACAGAAPTQAELVTAFGAANTHLAGFIGILDTSDSKCFIVVGNAAAYFNAAVLTKPA